MDVHDRAEPTNVAANTNTISSSENSANQPTPSNGFFKMDDFLSANQPAHDAQKKPRDKAPTVAAPTVAAPVALGARSSQYTVLLHQKYQALGILQPVFSFRQRVDAKWIAEISFPGLESEERLQRLQADSGYNSKQEAKEALCERAFLILEELEKEGNVTQTRHAANKNVGKQEMKEPAGPNYVGQLLEFQRATASPEGTYTDYSVSTRFACLLTLDHFPSPFGSLTSLHSSKKAARQDAARCAIDALKAQGAWPNETTPQGGFKKKMVAAPSSSTKTSSPSKPTSSTGQEPAPGSSYASQVAHLAVSLALPTPEWRFTPHPEHKDFVSVACVFRDAGPHEGPLGEVRNVFGKKKAKEECARLTLEYLKKVRETRLAAAKGLVEGLVGGESVVGAGVGRAVEGEGEEGEEDDLFADAVEEMDKKG